MTVDRSCREQGLFPLSSILSILVDSRSGPEAFDGFKLFSNFSMPVVVNNMSGIGGNESPPISGRSSSGSLVN